MALARCQSLEDQMELHHHRTHHHGVLLPKTRDALTDQRNREAHRTQNHRDHHLVA
jgi:hypothetical protein